MFLYLLAITGVMVNAHYCGKKLMSWNIYLKANPCDGSEGRKVHKCCKDKQVNAKVASDQQSSVSVKLQLASGECLPVNTPVFTIPQNTPEISEETAFTHKANAPPGRWQNIPLYKLHARLTYYG
jgi:hypothetical protein